MNIKHDKEKVIKSGLQLFCNKGYNSLGVDEICRVTGMTKGAFYNAFKSKEQFLIHTILLYGENNVQRIQASLETNELQSPIALLQTFYVSMLEAQPKSNYIGCFINNIMSELGSVSDTVGQASNIQFNSFIEAIKPTVLAAQEAGEFTKQFSAEQLTELIHTTFYGVLTRAKSSQDYQQGIETLKNLFTNLK